VKRRSASFNVWARGGRTLRTSHRRRRAQSASRPLAVSHLNLSSASFLIQVFIPPSAALFRRTQAGLDDVAERRNNPRYPIKELEGKIRRPQRPAVPVDALFSPSRSNPRLGIGTLHGALNDTFSLWTWTRSGGVHHRGSAKRELPMAEPWLEAALVES
jgi:hypothetical protein